jgi:hypothetical protein
MNDLIKMEMRGVRGNGANLGRIIGYSESCLHKRTRAARVRIPVTKFAGGPFLVPGKEE